MPDAVQSFPKLVVAPVSDETVEFEARLAECATLAVRVAFGVLRQREDAEDVAQEAFARAFRSFHQLREREAFRAWLVRMTWRLALDRRRGDKRRFTREQDVAADPVISGEAAVDQSDRSRRLWAAIDELPDVLRLTIVLASIEGHSIREVAQLTGAPEGTVKSRIFDAKQKLKERLS